MPVAVLLNAIVEALEMQLNELSSFLNLNTGQIETVSNSLLEESGEEP